MSRRQGEPASARAAAELSWSLAWPPAWLLALGERVWLRPWLAAAPLLREREGQGEVPIRENPRRDPRGSAVDYQSADPGPARKTALGPHQAAASCSLHARRRTRASWGRRRFSRRASRQGGERHRDPWEGRQGGERHRDPWEGRQGGGPHRDLWEGRWGGERHRDPWEGHQRMCSQMASGPPFEPPTARRPAVNDAVEAFARRRQIRRARNSLAGRREVAGSWNRLARGRKI